ncbi:hypothetical protein ACOSQ2_031095 [Xanthoceras sorbifolium]
MKSCLIRLELIDLNDACLKAQFGVCLERTRTSLSPLAKTSSQTEGLILKERRMGKGKGNPTGWIARVSTGQIPFEMDGVSLSNVRQAATLAAHKPCLSTKFVQWS